MMVILVVGETVGCNVEESWGVVGGACWKEWGGV